jgi:hypothetical protein
MPTAILWRNSKRVLTTAAVWQQSAALKGLCAYALGLIWLSWILSVRWLKNVTACISVLYLCLRTLRRITRSILWIRTYSIAARRNTKHRADQQMCSLQGQNWNRIALAGARSCFRLNCTVVCADSNFVSDWLNMCVLTVTLSVTDSTCVCWQ